MLRTRILRNVARNSTELPEVPPNVGIIFPTTLTTTRPFFVTGWKWALMFTGMIGGLYAGQKLAFSILTRKNPPNPPRIKDAEKPPSKHPHTPEDE
jgi:hypothetical protein